MIVLQTYVHAKVATVRDNRVTTTEKRPVDLNKYLNKPSLNNIPELLSQYIIQPNKILTQSYA